LWLFTDLEHHAVAGRPAVGQAEVADVAGLHQQDRAVLPADVETTLLERAGGNPLAPSGTTRNEAYPPSPSLFFASK